MKGKTTLGWLCFLMLSFSIGLLAGNADACDVFQTAYDDAKAKLTTAENSYKTAVRAAYKSANRPVPPEYQDEDDKGTVVEKTGEGVSVAVPNGFIGLLKGLNAPGIVKQHNDALLAVRRAETAVKEAGTRGV